MTKLVMDMTKKQNKAVARAIELSGSRAALAKTLGTTSVTVHRYLWGERKVSPAAARKINKVHKIIKLADLCPEVYGDA